MKKQFPPWFKPLVTSLIPFPKSTLGFLSALVAQQDIVRLPLRNRNYIINHPDAISHILLINEGNYTKEGTSYERIEQVVGKGLLTTSGEEWAIRRERYQPKFHGKHLTRQTEIIARCTTQLLEQWHKKKKRVVNLADEMMSLVMNISTQSLLGLDISAHSDEIVKDIHFLNTYAATGASAWPWLPTVRNLRYQRTRKKVDRFLLEQLQELTGQQEPLLADLLEKDSQGHFVLSPSEIVDEVKNFFVAGYETTGNAISWALYCLAKNPYALSKVLTEIKDGSNDHDGAYLDLVIQETLRLYPPIWSFTRKTLHEDVLLDYTIPANSIVNIVPYLLHRHPRYWDQPEVFYPERFLSNSAKNRPKWVYLPFGAGPRVCIGRQFATQLMKTILTILLQHYKFTLPDKNYHVDPAPFITLKPAKGMWLKIEEVYYA